MEYGLERKLKRDLFGFCYLHSRFYEDLDRYVPTEPTYHEMVAPLLPAGWQLQSEQVWYAAVPPKMSFIFAQRLRAQRNFCIEWSVF